MDIREMMEQIISDSEKIDMAAVDLKEADTQIDGADTLEARYHIVLTHLAFMAGIFRDYALGGPMWISHLKSSHDGEAKDALAHTVLILHALRDDLPKAIKAEVDRGAINPEGDPLDEITQHVRNTLDLPFYEQNQPTMERLNEIVEAIKAGDESQKEAGSTLFGELKRQWGKWLEERTARGVTCIGHRDPTVDSASDIDEGHHVPGKGEA